MCLGPYGVHKGGSVFYGRGAPVTLYPTPCTLHPAPCTLHPAPYILHPTPYTLHPTPYTLHPAPCILHPTPYTLHPAPCTLHPKLPDIGIAFSCYQHANLAKMFAGRVILLHLLTTAVLQIETERKRVESKNARVYEDSSPTAVEQIWHI